MTTLTSEVECLTAKVAKYKENNDVLKEAIDSHQKVQKELQAKLQQEGKANAGEKKPFQSGPS